MVRSSELQSIFRVRVDACRALLFAFSAVLDAHPVRESFHLHLLLELVAVPQAQINSAFVV